ncbi:amino acid transporter AVT6C-like [Telopea speciosissima]|uniref:amino acid transporter AVT6C-like n=1 Tax=Telopea speciosissima TaxID=54955 RepID=UPI001CC6C542|nr:amino acid transporter AVT6C-like [Telopea speciosissima]
MKKEADIHASLLPELRPPLESKSTDTDGGASVSGAVFNVSTSIIGAGIMSIPATFKVLGVVPALAMMVIIAILSDVSVNFLLKYTNAGNSTTYAGVMREAFGRIGSLALQICVMLTNLGALIIFLIIIGDVLSGSQSEGSIHLGVLQEWFGFHWWNTRAFALLFTTLFVFLPLVLLRHVESLRFTSAISVLLAIVFVGISSVMAILALCEGKTQSPRLLPDLAHQASFFDLFTAAPVIVTAFTFHFNVHPIAVELQNPSKMVSAARISIVLCATIYLTVGFFGYLLFGDSTMPDILSNFDRNSDSPIGSILNDTVRLSYALHLMLVFPLVNFSLRANIHELLFTKSPQSTSADTTRFVFLTSFLLVFIYIAAIALPNIWYFFQFMGSTSAVSLALIFPGAIVLRDVHGISTRRETILAALMIILALITSSIAISSNIISLTRKL